MDRALSATAGNQGGVFARRRRVRLGGLHLRQHANADRDHAAADYHQARTIRLRGRDRDCGGHAGGLICIAADHQPVAGMERRTREEQVWCGECGLGTERGLDLNESMATTFPLTNLSGAAARKATRATTE